MKILAETLDLSLDKWLNMDKRNFAFQILNRFGMNLCVCMRKPVKHSRCCQHRSRIIDRFSFAKFIVDSVKYRTCVLICQYKFRTFVCFYEFCIILKDLHLKMIIIECLSNKLDFWNKKLPPDICLSIGSLYSAMIWSRYSLYIRFLYSRLPSTTAYMVTIFSLSFTL